MSVHYLAALCAAVAAWVFGAIWYTVLASPWKAALGLRPDEIRTAKPQVPVGARVVSFAAELLMAAVLSVFMQAFEHPTWLQGALVGAHCWLGFVVTTIVVNNAYPGRKTLLTVIDSGHWLGVLLIEGAVLGAMA